MIVLAVLAAAASAALIMRPAGDPRIRALSATPRASAEPRAMRRQWTWLAASVAAVGALVAFPGLVGVLLAGACLVLLPRWLVMMDSRTTRQRTAEVERQAPLLADLLAGLLASGATVRDALQAASEAMPEPTARILRAATASVDLGADPADAWLATETSSAHRPMIEALQRAHHSGAPAAPLLARVADDLRRDRRRTVEVAARSAGVRAVAPLALCFLPAFVLLGVVPVVASLASGVLGG